MPTALPAVTLGGSVRVELESREGTVLEAELDREAWRDLRLAVGDGVTAVPRALRVFPALHPLQRMPNERMKPLSCVPALAEAVDD